PERAQLAVLRAAQRLQRGRRAPQHGDGARFACPDQRQVAGVIPEPVLLFVGGLVLLVDDDDRQVAKRREDGAPRADHHAGGAGVSLTTADPQGASASRAAPAGSLRSATRRRAASFFSCGRARGNAASSSSTGTPAGSRARSQARTSACRGDRAGGWAPGTAPAISTCGAWMRGLASEALSATRPRFPSATPVALRRPSGTSTRRPGSTVPAGNR